MKSPVSPRPQMPPNPHSTPSIWRASAPLVWTLASMQNWFCSTSSLWGFIPHTCPFPHSLLIEPMEPSSSLTWTWPRAECFLYLGVYSLGILHLWLIFPVFPNPTGYVKGNWSCPFACLSLFLDCELLSTHISGQEGPVVSQLVLLGWLDVIPKTSWIPPQGTGLDYSFGHWSGCVWKAAHWCFFLTSMFLSLSFSLPCPLSKIKSKKKIVFKRRPSGPPLSMSSVRLSARWISVTVWTYLLM